MVVDNSVYAIIMRGIKTTLTHSFVFNFIDYNFNKFNKLKNNTLVSLENMQHNTSIQTTNFDNVSADYFGAFCVILLLCSFEYFARSEQYNNEEEEVFENESEEEEVFENESKKEEVFENESEEEEVFENESEEDFEEDFEDNELQIKYDDLKIKYNDLRISFNTYKNKYIKLQDSYSKLQDSNSKLQKLNSGLEGSISRLQTSYSGLQDTNNKLQDTNNKLQSSNMTLQDTNKKLQDTNMTLQGSISRLQMSNTKLQEYNSKLEGEIELLKFENSHNTVLSIDDMVSQTLVNYSIVFNEFDTTFLKNNTRKSIFNNLKEYKQLSITEKETYTVGFMLTCLNRNLNSQDGKYNSLYDFMYSKGYLKNGKNNNKDYIYNALLSSSPDAFNMLNMLNDYLKIE